MNGVLMESSLEQHTASLGRSGKKKNKKRKGNGNRMYVSDGVGVEQIGEREEEESVKDLEGSMPPTLTSFCMYERCVCTLACIS